MGMSRKERQEVGKVQDLIGAAEGWHHNDRSQDAHGKVTEALKEAFEICVALLSKYPPT